MKFPRYDWNVDKPELFVENVVDELRAAGLEPVVEVIKESVLSECLGKHTAKVPNSESVAVFNRRVADWSVEFRSSKGHRLCRLDETPAFKKFAERNDVAHWGAVRAGWSQGYSLQTPEAFSTFTKLLREEPMYVNRGDDNS